MSKVLIDGQSAMFDTVRLSPPKARTWPHGTDAVHSVTLPSAYEVVLAWHREEHGGRLDHCTEQPCHAVARSNR